jgi:hypothetical protein
MRLSGHVWFPTLDKTPAAVQHFSQLFSRVTDAIWSGQMILK